MISQNWLNLLYFFHHSLWPIDGLAIGYDRSHAVKTLEVQRPVGGYDELIGNIQLPVIATVQPYDVDPKICNPWTQAGYDYLMANRGDYLGAYYLQNIARTWAQRLATDPVGIDSNSGFEGDLRLADPAIL